MGVDLVCWDFGDTLVDERFMLRAPDGVPEWTEAYLAVRDERPDWVEAWDHGRGSINDLIEPMAGRLPMMTRAEIGLRLREVWRGIEWFADSRVWVERLTGRVDQAVVTVNPNEFAAIAANCDLDRMIPVLVTSAEVESLSKVVMAERARELLDLEPGLTTTVLIDNKEHNTDEFTAAGGHAIVYRPESGCLDRLHELVSGVDW